MKQYSGFRPDVAQGAAPVIPVGNKKPPWWAVCFLGCLDGYCLVSRRYAMGVSKKPLGGLLF